MLTIINSTNRFEAEIDIDAYVKDYVDVEAFMECCKACQSTMHWLADF